MEQNDDSEEVPSSILELSRIVAGLLAENKVLSEEKGTWIQEKETLLD